MGKGAKQTAEILNVKPITVYKWANSGVITLGPLKGFQIKN
jgi:hypothetical protein